MEDLTILFDASKKLGFDLSNMEYHKAVKLTIQIKDLLRKAQETKTVQTFYNSKR